MGGWCIYLDRCNIIVRGWDGLGSSRIASQFSTQGDKQAHVVSDIKFSVSEKQSESKVYPNP